MIAIGLGERVPDRQQVREDRPQLHPRQTGGEEFVTLLESEVPAHTHFMQGTNVAAARNNPGGNLYAAPTSGNAYNTGGGLTPMSLMTLAPAGGSLPHNNLQPYLTFYFCIALQGVFPPRT